MRQIMKIIAKIFKDKNPSIASVWWKYKADHIRKKTGQYCIKISNMYL